MENQIERVINNHPHPEQKPDEIYIGNVNQEGFWDGIGWKTKRMGVVAYDIYGEVIPQAHDDRSFKALGWGIFPVFIKCTEVEEHIKTETDEHTIRTLSEMLEAKHI